MADLYLTPAPDYTSLPSSFTSASTSYAHNNYDVYDVFINHCGKDCKKTFATYLYDRLRTYGLRVFLDQHELQEGDRFTSQIEGAIRTASVQIAIFSPRYAESSWCLDELLLMLQSKKTILPVFYGVKPSDLRWTQDENGVYARLLRMLPWVLCLLCCTTGQNGVYARALRALQGKKTLDSQTGQEKPRYDSNTIGKWKTALSDVSYISGFDRETCNGDEERLVQKVVERVLKKVKRKLHVSKYPIALDEKVKDFERKMFLQHQSGQTRVIGIVGLGGVGKTTLAKEIFNRQISNYDRSCFLNDVKDGSLKSLQRRLLKDLTGRTEEIDNIDEGMEMLKRYLSSTRALIILDDVDDIHQLDALHFQVKDVLKSDSLIIVTSRNRDVLTRGGIIAIYKLTELNQQHSKELFCSHAFDQSHPAVGFENEVEEFVDACQGLPSSLNVFGALLRGKTDLIHWKAQLLKISRILPQDIQSKLKISYDGLDEENKQIFLDIACFFIGEDRDTVIRIWEGSGCGRLGGWLGLQNLEERCLVEINSRNRITMHDHLRDLGRNLANEEPRGCPLRLCRPTENLHHLSDESPVRGISMVADYGWPPQSCKKLSQLTGSLQLLRAEGYCVESILSVADPPPLTWLCWKNCPYSSLPPWFPTEKLRVLQIKGSKLETLWSHESQAPVQMTELNIQGDLLNIPKSIRKLKHLEKIVLFHEEPYHYDKILLHYSSHYPELLERSRRSMSKLNHFKKKFLHPNRSKPVGLKTLPDEFCHLQSLKHLELYCCSRMESLPESFGDLTNLQHIVLANFSKLRTLPDSFGNLMNLQSIGLSYCSHLEMLPDSFGNLMNLQRIDLSYCSHLEMLPESFGNLMNLQSIDLSYCSHLEMLPDSFGNLMNLQSIDLYDCSHLEMLPDSFGNLVKLQYINLSECSRLEMLPNSFSNCKNLKNITMTSCSNLQSFPSIEKLESLEWFDVSNCVKLRSIRTLEHLTNLLGLDIDGCTELQELPSIETLVSLEELSAHNCVKLKSIRGLEHLTKLRRLNIKGCKELQELPTIETLVSLEELCAANCVKLKSIRGLQRLTKLRLLDVMGCSKLEELPGLEHLIRSLVLCAHGCPKLQRCGPVIEQLGQLLEEGFII